MGRVKCSNATDRENNIRKTKHVYHSGLEPSIRAAASTYGVPYGALRDRLRGAQPRSVVHEKEQLLTLEEEKSIVRFCKTLDDLGHLLQAKMVKAFAMSLVPPHWR
jgi:hypothetical protein